MAGNTPIPAIDIARLKIQAAVLVEKFDQPAVFLKGLHEILDHYADRTMRIGVVASPVSVLPAYRAPQAGFRPKENGMAPPGRGLPPQGLAPTGGPLEGGHLRNPLVGGHLPRSGPSGKPPLLS